MEKIDFSNLYKFIVSIGLVLISLAIAIPWLVLHEPFDTNIKQNDIAELTKTAQQIVEIKQVTGLWLISHAITLSVIVAAFGVIIFLIGVFLWVRRQKLSDEKEEIEVKKLRIEISPMTGSQISQKALEELGIDTLTTEADWNLAMYQNLQSKVISYITSNCLTKSQYRVISNRQMDGNRYDIILEQVKNKGIDYLIEVRFSPNKIQTPWAKKIIGKTILAKQNYVLNTGRKAKAIILFYASKNCLPDQGFVEYQKTLGLSSLSEEVQFGFLTEDDTEKYINDVLISKVISS